MLPFLVCLAAALAAQHPGDKQPESDAAALSAIDPSQGRVRLDVTVTDAQGRAATGLTQADFKLLDQGQAMPLVSFAASGSEGPTAGDPPVSVILVLDEADLPAANRPEAQSDLEEFLRADGGKLARPVTVYRVTSDKLFAAGPSRDGNALADQIASGMGLRKVWKEPGTRIEHGPTGELELVENRGAGVVTFQPPSFPDSLKCLGAITIEQRRLPGRKLLFWIGPGWRVDAKEKNLLQSITEFSTRLREARIELSVANRWLRREAGKSMLSDAEIRRYADGIHLEQTPYYNLALQVLAERTGGGTLTSSDDHGSAARPGADNIARLISEHIGQASDYYHLTFDPPETGVVDEYHAIRVEVTRAGLAAHTIAGYFNEPVFYDQPMPAAAQVTVAQLEQRLGAERNDRTLADELGEMQLTERLSTPRLEAWLKRLPGERSRQALTALADASVFLPPPADEELAKPMPDKAARQAMFLRVVEFLAQQVPRLPNFYAERATVQYGEPEPKPGETWKTAQPDRKLYYERTDTERIFFENGKETVDHQKAKVKQGFQTDLLETSGTFGPVLALAIRAALAPGGMLEWSRWEKGAAGPVAVFDYASSPSLLDYEVGFCCLAVDGSDVPFLRRSTFHGEIGVDPDTGHILRLTVEANLEPRLPLKNSAIMVEYGPVAMGGETYICPLRSVSRSRQRRLWELEEWGMQFKLYGPFKTVLNDVTFSRYHLFRSQTTILPGFEPVPQAQ